MALIDGARPDHDDDGLKSSSAVVDRLDSTSEQAYGERRGLLSKPM